MAEQYESPEDTVDLEHLDIAYLHTFTSGPGAQVLEDLLKTYFYVPLMNPSDRDPTAMLAMREGQRSVVLQIVVSMVRADRTGDLTKRFF